MLGNWLLNKSVIVGLTVAILIFSCKSGSDEISGNIQPDEQRISTYFTDTMKLATSIVLFDSVRSNASSRMLVGSYNDPLFGKIKAQTFAQFNVTNFENSLGPNPKLDSIFLYLTVTASGFGKYYYGIPNTVNKIYVHRLTESLPNKILYISDNLSYDAVPIAVGYLTDSDTLFKFKVSAAFGQEMIDNPTIFSSNATFIERFKGLLLKGDDADQRIWGIVIASIQLKYYNYYALNNLLVSEETNINVSSTASERLIKLEVDRNSTPYLNSLNKTYDTVSAEQSQNACLVQGGTGVGTKIRFPGLENFVNNIKGKVLINRAEIVIKPINTDSSIFTTCPELQIYQLDENGKIKKTIDGEYQYLQLDLENVYGSSSNKSVIYDATDKVYRIRITTYMQAIVDGNIPNYGILLKGTGSSGMNVNRTVFYNDPLSPYNIKLKIYYSPYK